MKDLEKSIEKLQSRAGNQIVRDAIEDVLSPNDKYGLVPLVHEKFRDSACADIDRVTGIVLGGIFRSDLVLGVSVEVIPPEDEEGAIFLGNAVGLLDPLVPRHEHLLDLNMFVSDLTNRYIKSVGAIALFEGEEASVMMLAVPRVLSTDSGMPYAGELVKSTPSPAPSTIEQGATILTAAVLDSLLSGNGVRTR